MIVLAFFKHFFNVEIFFDKFLTQFLCVLRLIRLIRERTKVRVQQCPSFSPRRERPTERTPSLVFTIAILRTLPNFLIGETRRVTLLSSSSSSESFLSFFFSLESKLRILSHCFNQLALHCRFYMCQIAIFLKPLIVLSFNFLLKSSETNALFFKKISHFKTLPYCYRRGFSTYPR